jgi:UDP-N-acetylmuramoylalanine--D-glutamate ligase
MNFKGRRVLVVGMEKSGAAVTELLAREGAVLTASDQKPLDQLKPEARTMIDRTGAAFKVQSPEVFEDVDLIVLSPGVPADLPEIEKARSRGTEVAGDVEIAGWFLKGPAIGITGSNGKTTTTALTGHILKQCGVPVQVGGNIGTPVASMVDSSRDDQWNVLELSSFQLETLKTFRCRIGVCLNVTPDHLDRHHTFEKYSEAKRRLFNLQCEGDYAVLNALDPECVAYAADIRARPHWFSSGEPRSPGISCQEGMIWLGAEAVLPADEVPIRGLHNLENTMAAILAANLAGVHDESKIAAAVRTFRAVEHRLEFVRSRSGVAYYNDSKATNVDATLKAINAFDGGLWVILGGKDKGSDYTPLGDPLAAKAKAVLLIGAAAPKIAGQLESFVPLISAGTIESAVAIAADAAVPGDTVLLAPACASFDQFDNYEHRGRVFKQLVNALEGV